MRDGFQRQTEGVGRAEIARRKALMDRLASAWPDIQRDPIGFIRRGGLFIPAPDVWFIDEHGCIQEHITGQSPRVVPFFPTDAQNAILDLMLMFKEAGHQAHIIVAKTRRAGASDIFQALSLMGALTRTQTNNIIVHPDQKMADEILAKQKLFYAEHPLISLCFNEWKNNTSEFGVEATDLPFEISQSLTQALNADPASIEKKLGGGCNAIHDTETGYGPDPEKVDAALQPSLRKGASSWRVKESAGYDNEYFPRVFKECWIKQGGANFWEVDDSGNSLFKWGEHFMKAIFLYSWMDPQKRGWFRPGRGIEDLYAVLDEEEKRIREEALRWHVRVKGRTVQRAHQLIASFLCWRRVMLNCIYGNDGIVDHLRFIDSPVGEEAFRKNYPASVAEMLEGDKASLAVPVEVRGWLDEVQRAPKFIGTLRPVDASATCGPYRLVRDATQPLHIWKWPWECKGTIIAACDPHEGTAAKGRIIVGDDDETTDYCALTLWDMETGLQVAELLTSEDAFTVAKDILALLRFYSMRESFTSDERIKMDRADLPAFTTRGQWNSGYSYRYPFYCHDIIGKTHIWDYVVRMNYYPESHILKKESSSKSGDAVIETSLGFDGRAMKRDAGEYMITLLVNGMRSYRSMPGEPLAADGLEHIERLVPLSQRMNRQLKVFCRKGEQDKPVYEAMDKGKKSKQRHDDLAITLLMAASGFRQIRIRNGIGADMGGGLNKEEMERQHQQRQVQEIRDRYPKAAFMQPAEALLDFAQGLGTDGNSGASLIENPFTGQKAPAI